MKRFLACLLLAAALLSVCGGAMALGGEDLKLTSGVDAKIICSDRYIYAVEGPGEFYPRVSHGLHKGSKVKAYAWMYDEADMTWILVEANGKWFYLLQDDGAGTVLVRCNLKKLPKEPVEMQSAWQCSCYESLRLRKGPGAKYGYTGFVMGTRENAWVVLTKGKWALVECTNAYDSGVRASDVYIRRGWVPFSSLIY